MHLSSTSKKILLALLSLFILIYIYFEASTGGDFRIFLLASHDIFEGVNIYEKTYFDGYHYFYSTFFAVLIYPLTFLPVFIVSFLWLCLNCFFVYRLYKIIASYLPLNKLNNKQKLVFWILGIVFSLRLVMENFHVIQVTIFILYLCLEGLNLIHKQKIMYGAFLIALGINIKLLPIVILPYLLYRKEFKAAIFIGLFYTIMLFMPNIFIGTQQNHLLLKTWLNLVNPLNTNHILDTDERSFHGITTLLSVLFYEHAPDKYALPIKRNIADVNLQTLSYIILTARLSFIAFTFYFLKSVPFKKATTALHAYWEVSYILMIIPLIFPHQQHYAFLFIIPAFLYSLFYLISNYTLLNYYKKNTLIIMLSIIYLVVNLKLLLGEFNHYYEHYKILTYGAIVLIIVLAMCKPLKSNTL